MPILCLALYIIIYKSSIRPNIYIKSIYKDKRKHIARAVHVLQTDVDCEMPTWNRGSNLDKTTCTFYYPIYIKTVGFYKHQQRIIWGSFLIIIEVNQNVFYLPFSCTLQIYVHRWLQSIRTLLTAVSEVSTGVRCCCAFCRLQCNCLMFHVREYTWRAAVSEYRPLLCHLSSTRQRGSCIFGWRYDWMQNVKQRCFLS